MEKGSILIITDKVMPYRSAFYRELSNLKDFSTKVLYLDDWGVDNSNDQTLNVNLSWDGPILKGFKHEFLKSKRFKARYTGVDRVKAENIPIIGNIIFYLRVFIGVISFQFLVRLFKDKSDVFILEGYSSLSYLLAILVLKVRRKKVVLRGEPYLHGKKPFYIRFIKSIYLRMIFPLFDMFCYGCAATKKFYCHYGTSERKCVFVPSSVDHEYFMSEMAKLKNNGNPLRKRIDKQNKMVFLAIGRFVKRKRWEDYLEALAGLDTDKIITIFVGGGPTEAGLHELVEKHNIKNVYFEGFRNQSEISKYYDFADVFILPSDYDPTPKVLNEALEFGLPVLLSNTIGTADQLCVNNGYIFEKGNIDDLREKLELIISDSNSLREFSANSLQLASEWSLKKGVNNIYSALTKL